MRPESSVMRVVISAREEGGRLEQAIEAAGILEGRGHEVIFVGGATGRESEVVPRAGFRFRPLTSQGRGPRELLRRTWRSIRMLGIIDPDLLAFVGPGSRVQLGVAAMVHRIRTIALYDESPEGMAEAVASWAEDRGPAGRPVEPLEGSPPDKRAGWDASWRRFHVVGVGGAAMSALARILKWSGFEVSGCDAAASDVLDDIARSGIEVTIGHDASHVEDTDVVVVSAAIPVDAAELAEARRRSLPVLGRGEAQARALGDKRSIAVSGTHGKTTTSGMVATILEEAGKDPTYLIGAALRGRGPGARLGEGELAVVEADEAYGAFLHLKPAIAVLTSIDRDHLDHYGDFERLVEAFESFLGSASERVVVCTDDEQAAAIAPEGALTYGIGSAEGISAGGLAIERWGSKFQLRRDGEPLGRVELAVPGRHNVQNALAAAAACLAAGVDPADVVKGLSAYHGADRRFERKGSFQGAEVVEGYAHLPREIEADIDSARQGGWARVVTVFQPHLYSRTRSLAREFGEALALSDAVVVTDVFGAREEPIPGVTGKLVADAVCEAAPGKRVAYLPGLGGVPRYLGGIVREDDVILMLGAGDIGELAGRIASGADA